MDPVDVVRAGYDAIGARYHEWSHRDPDRLEYVARLRSRLAPGSVVVELGSGPGDPATRLLAESFRVVGVELSWTQIGIARGHAPRAAFVQADMTRLSVRPGSVDGVASFYAFGHLPRVAHAPLLARVGSWLRPGGVLVTTLPLGDDEGTEDGWLGVPMFFGGIGREASVAAVEAGGLVVESVEPRGEDGETFDWLTAVRPAAPAR